MTNKHYWSYGSSFKGFSDWLKLNCLRSRIERGFLDIFSRHICSAVTETIRVTNYATSFGARKCSENQVRGCWDDSWSVKPTSKILSNGTKFLYEIKLLIILQKKTFVVRRLDYIHVCAGTTCKGWEICSFSFPWKTAMKLHLCVVEFQRTVTLSCILRPVQFVSYDSFLLLCWNQRNDLRISKSERSFVRLISSRERVFRQGRLKRTVKCQFV